MARTHQKILVTGGAGYIGSHVVLALHERGYSSIVIDNLSTGSAASLVPGAIFVHGDVGCPQTLNRLFAENDIAAVLHLAGSIVVSESISNPILYYHNNTANSLALARVCLEHGIDKFIFSSTAAVYGSPAVIPVTEDCLTQPINPYGTSKLMTEWILRDIAQASSLRYIALRYFNVAGADLQGRAGSRLTNATNLIKVACEFALGRRPKLSIYGNDFPTHDGTGVRDYIHVSDLADAHVVALEYLIGGGASAVLNCGYGHGYSVLEVVRAIERYTGRPLPVSMEARRAGDPAIVISCPDRLHSLLNWTPHLNDLDEIIQTAMAWEEKLLA